FENTLITTDLRYVGERKSEGGYDLDDFFTADLGIEQNLNLGIWQGVISKTKLLIYANNIFEENYEEVYGYPMPDRVFGVSLTVTFF
ncbi:MAG: hypothetical protein SV775_00165, partial [Thermodesulfobacteriota bacterium]|nr:hypothetical protein [Thermodesulfobacteriota bacterium]